MIEAIESLMIIKDLVIDSLRCIRPRHHRGNRGTSACLALPRADASGV